MSFIGPHVSKIYKVAKDAGIDAHVEAARQEAENAGFRMHAVAFFAGGPQSYEVTLKKGRDDGLGEYLRAQDMIAIAHNAYVGVPWKGNKGALGLIKSELNACLAHGVSGLVVHLPGRLIDDIGVLQPLIGVADDVTIFFETPQVRPERAVFASPEGLGVFYERLRESLVFPPHKFGLCIDTAHLWACGVDISSFRSAEDWLRRLDEVLPGVDVMVHLNDSTKNFGCGNDIHAPIGWGKIWGDYRESLEASGAAAFLAWMNEHKAVGILERAPKEVLTRDYNALLEMGFAGD